MENKLIFKSIILDIDRATCFIGGVGVDLTKNEYLLLKFLMENKNKVFSRQQLLNEVWGTKVSLRTVDTTISRLRKKMYEMGSYIKTRQGFGYGFIE